MMIVPEPVIVPVKPDVLNVLQIAWAVTGVTVPVEAASK
jgi:hypothetical protein